MRKKRLLLAHRKSEVFKSIRLNLRRTTIIVFCAMLTLSTSVYSQSKKVSLDVKNISFSKLFEQIRKQSSYSFFFNEEKLSKLKSITVKKNNVTVKEILKEVLTNTNLTYTMIDNVIIIKNIEVVKVNASKEEITIKGVITDLETGEPLPGASIFVKDRPIGTSSDINGVYKIVLVKPVTSLMYSFLGYQTQEIKINNSKRVNVQLKGEPNQLDQVVINGYQRIDKRELTSSIERIKGKDLELKNALTVDQMLEGKVTGLQVTNISATPGAAAKIRIRGGNTFTGNQTPLWVIDGVIYEEPVKLSSSEINSFDNVNIIGNALTGVNPRDIESINVLKDASATAIYGVRAASGVIAITTKRGKEGTPKFSYSLSSSVVDRPHYSDFNLMNSKERIAVSREMYKRNLGTPAAKGYDNIDRIGYEGALINYWDETYNFQQFNQRVGYLESLNANWFGALYRPAFNKSHNINVSGGSSKSRYYVSLGYDDQKGTEKGVELSRITARANLDFDLRDNVLLSFKINGSVQEGKYNHSSINTFNEAFYTSRTVPVYNNNGELSFLSKPLVNNGFRITDEDNNLVYGRHHVLNEMNNSERNITNKDLGVSASLKWSFLNGFKFRSQASYRNTTNLQEEWINENTFHVAELRTYDVVDDYISSTVDNNASVPFGGLYSGGMVSQNSYTITNQLNYNKVIGDKHVINVNLAQEARSTKYWGATGFTVPGYSHDNGRRFIYLPRVRTNSGSYDFENYPYDNMINWFSSGELYPSITDRTSNSMSFFSMLNYVYDKRYVLNFNIRSDGTNTFGQFEKYRFKPTWSVSSRWNIHNEKFWNDDSKIDELSLRSSYGVRGTIPTASPYMTIRNYGPETNSGYFQYNENVAQLVNFPQTNLRWELNKTLNIGLNYSLFEGRVSGAFDYAYSLSEDLLLVRPVSAVNGAFNQQFNAGSKDVQSYELSIRTVNVKTKDFSWSTRFNISHDVDRVLKGFEEAVSENNAINQNPSLTIGQYLNGGIYRKGFPSSGFYSYQFDGLDNQGLPTFKHLNEPNSTPEEQLKMMLVYEGQRLPKYYGGFGTEFRYKRLSVSANFNYKLGYKTRLLNLYKGSQQLPLPYENMQSEFNNRWTQPGDELLTDIPALSNELLNVNDYSTNSSSGIFPNGATLWNLYDLSDARTVRGDHIRLSSVSLSYSTPKELVKTLGVESMILGVQASNVAVWAFDSKLKGQDPDQVRNIGVPNRPTFSFSLNVGL